MFRTFFARNGYRLLTRRERRHLRQHLERLSELDLRHRFDHAPGPEELRAHIDREWPEHEFIGWFEHGVLRGAIEIFYHDDHAEAGVTVEPAWRGHGVGTELVRRAMEQARGRGATSLSISASRGDAAMIDMAARMGGRMSFGHWRAIEPEEANTAMRAWIEFDLHSPAAEPASEGVVGRLRKHLARLLG